MRVTACIRYTLYFAHTKQLLLAGGDDVSTADISLLEILEQFIARVHKVKDVTLLLGGLFNILFLLAH